LLKKIPSSAAAAAAILPPDAARDSIGIEPPADVAFLGRPTLLWLLEHADLPATDCVGGETGGGRVLVRVTRGGLPYGARLFNGASAAVQWALEVETTLMDGGWTKTI
jgi:hypothetical protein